MDLISFMGLFSIPAYKCGVVINNDLLIEVIFLFLMGG
jgi:hypothetical protein